MVCFMTITLVIQQNKPKLVNITFILFVIFITSAKEVMFLSDLFFIYLSICQQDYTKTKSGLGWDFVGRLAFGQGPID